MTHDELIAYIDDSTNGLKHEHLFEKLLANTKALRAVLQIKDRPRYSDTEADMWRSEAWNQALFVVREIIAKELG